MRVALVIERFAPDGGGMEAVAWRVAHGLAEAGDEVHVVARAAAESRAVRALRVEVRTAWQPLRLMRFSRAAARAAPRDRFDVVHAFSRTREQDLYRAGGGSHADYMQRAYGPAGRALRRLSPRHAVLLRMERAIFGDPRQTVQCGSGLVREQIAARYGVPATRLAVLYNGVDARRFRPPLERPVRADAVFLFAGSGFARKGLGTALSALARSASRRSRLWVAGRDAPARWQRLAGRLGVGERVTFLGHRSDLDALYREVDALLLPSRYDAFANACLEAASSGLPVVTSGANGSGELLDGAGIVVEEPEDVAGFASALDRLEDPALRARLGERGRELAERLTWEAHVDALRELYRRLRR
jgi:UDP-glucose:(heptosyl)LPS alpha-1,3-glucosyltransferase